MYEIFFKGSISKRVTFCLPSQPERYEVKSPLPDVQRPSPIQEEVVISLSTLISRATSGQLDWISKARFQIGKSKLVLECVDRKC